MQEKAGLENFVLQYTGLYCRLGGVVLQRRGMFVLQYKRTVLWNESKARLDCIAIQCPAKPTTRQGAQQGRAGAGCAGRAWQAGERGALKADAGQARRRARGARAATGRGARPKRAAGPAGYALSALSLF